MRKGLIFFLCILFVLQAYGEDEINNRVLTIEELYNMALENSSALAEKTARQKAASYRVRETKSKGAPTLDFESNISYIHNPDSLTIEAGDFATVPMLIPAEDESFPLTDNTFYDFKLILDQPVFTWGKIYNAVQATKEGAAAASIDSMKMRDLIRTEILIHTTSLHYLKMIKAAIEIQNKIAFRLEEISNDSYENGMILYTEYLDAEMKKREAELTRLRIDEQLDQVLLNLIFLTGKELTEGDILSTDNSLDQDLASWQMLYNSALENNSDLQMLRHSRNAHEYKKNIQKGEFYFKPDLAFHMELSYSGSHFPFFQSGWADEDRGNFTMTLAIRTPLADFGGMYAAGKAAEEDYNASQAAYEQSLRQIEKFIRQTSIEIELNSRNIDYYNKRMDTYNKMMDQKEKEWLSGYGDEKDYLIEQINYYSNIILLYQERIKESANYYKLLNITGNINN